MNTTAEIRDEIAAVFETAEAIKGAAFVRLVRFMLIADSAATCMPMAYRSQGQRALAALIQDYARVLRVPKADVTEASRIGATVLGLEKRLAVMRRPGGLK